MEEPNGVNRELMLKINQTNISIRNGKEKISMLSEVVSSKENKNHDLFLLWIVSISQRESVQRAYKARKAVIIVKADFWLCICMCVHMCMFSHSVVSDSLWPMDYSPPGSSVHGILQGRILERVAMPSSRELSRPRDQTHVSCISCIGRWILYHLSHQGSPVCTKGAVYTGSVVAESGIECVRISFPRAAGTGQVATKWPKKAGVHSPTALETRRPKSRCQQALEALEKCPPLPLPASGGCELSLACSSIQPLSPSSCGQFLCVFVFSSVSCKETCDWIWYLPG